MSEIIDRLRQRVEFEGCSKWWEGSLQAAEDENARLRPVCDALIEDNQRLREALICYRDGICHGCASEHGAPEAAFEYYNVSNDRRATEAIAASDKALEEVLEGK